MTREESMVISTAKARMAKYFEKKFTDNFNTVWADTCYVFSHCYDFSTKYIREYKLYVTHSWGTAYCDWRNAKDEVLTILKESGAINIKGHASHNEILFEFDARKTLIKKFEAEVAKERAEKKAAKEAAWAAIDVIKYTPNEAVMEKISNCMTKNSKLNIGAIKNADKVYTYYTAACKLGWTEGMRKLRSRNNADTRCMVFDKINAEFLR